MQEHVLVTGAAGFIGAKTTELLLNQGQSVVGIDNLNDYYDPALKSHRLQSLKAYKNFTFLKADIEDPLFLNNLFEKYRFSTIYHLAARAGVRYSLENPHIYFSTNTTGTLNLLESMRYHEVPKLILASTSSLYAGQPMPFSESLPVNQPISPYAASKKAAEVLAYTYHHLFGLDVSVLRYFTVYGPAGRPDMSPYRFIQWIDEGYPIQLYGDGSQSRDFTYIDDIARGTLLANKPLGYEVINLGGGKNPISLLQMIQIIEQILGKKAKIKELPSHITDMHATWADIEKAKSLLDWQPTVPLQEGLEHAVQWYRDNKSNLKAIAI